MQITGITLQAKNPNRVNISVDKKYRFSLDLYQLAEIGLKKGQEIDEDQLAVFEQESEFGKLYARSLEYALMRPRSSKEMYDYLQRRSRATKYLGRDGTVRDREAVSTIILDRVYDRLKQKGYIDDYKFTRFWVENRHQNKGASRRKLENELRIKGVPSSVISEVLSETDRTDDTEIQKIIAKKRHKYTDNQKFMAYLARQGFSYDDIRTALDAEQLKD